MRILWYSNAPTTPTGYGTQTAQVVTRIKADGHDVAVLGNWGHDAGILDWHTPHGPVPMWPKGVLPYSLDVVDDVAKTHFMGNPGYVIALYDTWVLKKSWDGMHVASWTPVDHDPAPPEVVEWCKRHPRIIAMSKFGQRALADKGVDSVYIPHALDLTQWRPTASNVRERMRVPEDGFLITINAANIGNTPPRKAWFEMLSAFEKFAALHDDVYLYLHTDLSRPNGFPIGYWVQLLEIPPAQLRMTDLLAYKLGLFPAGDLAEVYTASDVLLATSMGEGFGLTVAEAMACGTPAIVTNFSAQPEIVGDTGWKVSYQDYADFPQGSKLATPSIPDIVAALENAYAEKGTAKATQRSEAAIAKVRQDYDADTVYDTMWRPLLAEMEDELKPIVKRQGKTNAAKRRARKAGIHLVGEQGPEVLVK